MDGFWHRPRAILIRNGLLEAVADQYHQNFRGKSNAVIRTSTRHHVERASDVLPSVQPRCVALQRPLMKRGSRCHAVQGRYVERGRREKSGGGGRIRVSGLYATGCVDLRVNKRGCQPAGANCGRPASRLPLASCKPHLPCLRSSWPSTWPD